MQPHFLHSIHSLLIVSCFCTLSLTSMEMAPYTRLVLHAFSWSLLAAISICSPNDIACLKSIRASLDDPHDYFKSSWNFNNYREGFICRFVGIDCWHADDNEVLNIRLTNMGLKGQFPLGIVKCKRLMRLDLSNNQLSGPIPSNISELFPFGTAIDISSNRFSGNIPKRISNCTFLNSLNLSNNQLTGFIPPELILLHRMKNFSVANNQLYGPVPLFNLSLSKDSFVGNPGLCGKPLEPCIEHKSSPFKNGFITGYAVSVVSVITIFMFYFAPCMHRNERNKLLRHFILNLIWNRTRKVNMTQNSNQTSQMVLPDILHETSRETSMLVELVSRMSYSDLYEATNEFSAENIIGHGQMGTTYKATSSNGCLLAIKRLFDTEKFDEHFITELKTLGRLRHDNLVPLLGFCIESKEKLLVYKYMSNGNLYDLLHPLEKRRTIGWPLRLKIACGVAKGLVWLHQNCNYKVIHLDICSRCILLDQNFEPKISNFSEAMLMKSNNRYWSSSFDMDSEFWESSFVKEDVYRFGILVLELISRKEPSELTDLARTGDESIGKWVVDDVKSSDFVDGGLVRHGFDVEIFEILRVAWNCVQPNPDERPAMLQVHKIINGFSKKYGYG
ncbi:probably inactive leucine-rich repeat receptor-like protein kinase At5g48380 [Gossypium raimondii]|nr:probably inactive leucine-rich repeat receptor-like protein kinase At5g48380 [Gossypium raimondii]